MSAAGPAAASPFRDAVVLAPLTVGGNLPFRRLCTELGADVTVGEMAVVRRLLAGNTAEFALLKGHPDERFFGVQLADKKPDSLAEGARIAEARGARFVDLNCGCPIDAITRRGLGASLLRKPTRLGRLVAAMKGAVGVPVTVKLRTGWSEQKANVSEVARVCEESGADAIVIHGRSREQRYSKAADWELVGRVAAERKVPVIGNGDILTPYEARERMARSGVRSVMLGRGALVKPWLFRELKTGEVWLPDAEQRLGVVWRLVTLQREHFGEDERGKRRALRFLSWHLQFFCRFVPLPEAQHAQAARERPLLHARLRPPASTPLERLLADERPASHERFAAELLAASCLDEARERCLRLARELPEGAASSSLVPDAEEVAG